MRRLSFAVVGLSVLLVAGCGSISANPAPTPTLTPPPSPTPAVGAVAQLRSALIMEDALTRREATLAAVAAYLGEPHVMDMDDQSASQDLTNLAFSTGRLVLPDPAFVRRAPGDPKLAVVGLPDGMGLALFDLRQPGSEPLLLTPWTASLQSVFVTWGDEEAGVNFLTAGEDGRTRAHFLLAMRDDDAPDWRATWYGDENRNWWLNAFQGQLEVAPDLSRLTLAGLSDGTTIAFDEGAGGVQRTFETTWERQGPVYVLAPDPADYESHQEWLWAVAQPGPYATLIEFLERLRNEDEGGASRLATSSVQALTAAQLGLNLPPRRYTVLEQRGDSIVFEDEVGRYEITFIPPPRDGEKWLVGDVVPLTETESADEPE